MKKWSRLCAVLCALSMLTVSLTACGGDTASSAEQPDDTAETIDLHDVIQIPEDAAPTAEMNPSIDGVLIPEASGTTTYGNSYTTIDASNINQGYVMVSYQEGETKRIKVQVSCSGGTTYTYNLDADGQYDVFPLSQGDGTYQINVFRNVSGDQYSQMFGQSISVKLSDQLLPFLYPNQYVDFNENSKVVAYADQLAAQSKDELDIVTNVYNYVVQNIKYDYDLAKTVSSTYLPVVDDVLAKGKGICFDYASVMSAMLRSQDIPTKLVVGYTSRGEYHAWISVHISQVGWIDNIISFDGKNWKLMDPTFASTGKSSKQTMDFINDPANYKEKFCY